MTRAAQTQRTDVEWVDGVPYCQTCNRAVSANDECGSECMQTELAKVLQYLRDKRKEASFYGDDGGSVYDALGEIIDDLFVGEHR